MAKLTPNIEEADAVYGGKIKSIFSIISQDFQLVSGTNQLIIFFFPFGRRVVGVPANHYFAPNSNPNWCFDLFM
jgi:hypothetical protein